MANSLTKADLTFFVDRDGFRAWLAGHGATTSELHLGYYRKGSGKPSITHAEAVEEALCFGWIDGIGHAIDAECYTVRFTPRKPKSKWSKKNVDTVERLEREGKMTDAGRAAVTAAQADGRWAAAYDGSRTITVPDDFAALLDAHPQAKAFFATLSAANRYAVLYRLHMATKPEARAKRLAEILTMLDEGRVYHPGA
jgi:uncharacterized protein YdeI (YjbR/CyaY-like superfamily)